MTVGKAWASAVRNTLRERGISNADAATAIGMMDVASFSNLLRNGRKQDEKRQDYSIDLGRICGVAPDAFEKPDQRYRPTSFVAHQACERIGQTPTLWVPTFVTDGDYTIDWNTIKPVYTARHYSLPMDYSSAYQEALRGLRDNEENRARECLISADLIERGEQYRQILELNFGYSDYASKRAITSTAEGRALAHKELSRWEPGKRLIPYLHVGVGCHIILISSDNKAAFARRRNQLRHGEWDTGAVEGMAPYLDSLWYSRDVSSEEQKRIWSANAGQQFDLKAFFLRALNEEYRVKAAEITELNFFGLGQDMFYGQWNFIGSAYINKPFSEIEKKWPRAMSRDENFPVKPVQFDVESIENEIHDKRIWSSAIAALLYGLRWHYKSRLKLEFPYDRGLNHRFRMMDEDQYRLVRESGL